MQSRRAATTRELCACSGNSVPGGSVVITQYQSLPLSPRESPPHKCHPVVLAPRTPWGAFRRGFRRVPRVAWTPGLIVTSQPGPCPTSLHCRHRMHLEQKARHPLASDARRTAPTIRAEFLAWCLGNYSHIAHFARVW
jgi:hypothetical protein